MSFFWRVAVINAAIFALGGVLLVTSPATVSAPVAASEVAILAGGILTLLAINVLVLRWGFAPLDRLVTLMRDVDLARPAPFLDEDGPAEIRTVIVTSNAMLGRLRQERRSAARIALRAEEAERERVARELHDEIGQSLTAVLMALTRTAESAPPGVREDVLAAREAARSSLQDVRRVAQRLRPESLDDLGLPRALATLCRRVEDGSGVPVERRIAPHPPPLTREEELAIYRIAQEALTNAVRHAEASRVTVVLEPCGEGVALRIRDDGRGRGGRPAGGGLTGMRERALLIGADLQVEDHPDGGTEVGVRLGARTMAGVA